jgi:hypothetical protein
MFQATSCPSSGATTAVVASGLPIVIRDTAFKRQVLNLRSCYILLVDSVESMMMHGLANPRFINAEQAGDIYAYRNVKRKLHKTIAVISFNKTWKQNSISYDNR